MRFDENIESIVLHGPHTDQDYIEFDGAFWHLRELYKDAGDGKGKNSCVFRALDPNGEDDVIVKFCKFHKDMPGEFAEKKRARFKREIDAMEKASKSNSNTFILEMLINGERNISGHKFLYYAMEEADCDLAKYLATEVIEDQQRIYLCYSIFKSLQALHKLDIYHRDIKPDNVFCMGSDWKIGDLGFIGYRDEDSFDGPRERIGPTALMSPEAVNKTYANHDHPDCNCDCIIDDKSDLFQLGKLFWFIMQHEVPTGLVHEHDIKSDASDLYTSIIFPLMQYAKNRRPDAATVEASFEPIRTKYVI